MTSIFINYRRDDTSGYSGRIHERLASVFGSNSVFMDLDDIHPGANFVRTIDEGLVRCDVMIVLIGKRWLEVRDAAGQRRIDNPDDFVELEIAKALERNIRIIPVLVNNAPMPAEKELPAALARLASIQATELSDERWDYDFAQLLGAIRGNKTDSSGSRKRWVGIAIAIALLIGAALALTSWLSSPPPNFAGEWVTEIHYDFDGVRSERFVFRVDGGTLAGVASFLGVDRSITEGQVTNDKISFTTRTEEFLGDEKRQTQHRYRGTLANNEIRFVMQTEGGFSDHPPVEGIARRRVSLHPGGVQ